MCHKDKANQHKKPGYKLTHSTKVQQQHARSIQKFAYLAYRLQRQQLSLAPELLKFIIF